MGRVASIINATDQLFAGKDYKALIVAYRNGRPGGCPRSPRSSTMSKNTKQAAWMNETPAVIVNIQRQPGTNVIGCRPGETLLPAITGNVAVVGAGYPWRLTARPDSGRPFAMCSSNWCWPRPWSSW